MIGFLADHAALAWLAAGLLMKALDMVHDRYEVAWLKAAVRVRGAGDLA